MPHDCLEASLSFCIKNKPIETKAQGVAAAAKNEMTCAIGSYKFKSDDDHNNPATGAMSNGFDPSDLIAL